MGMALKDGMNAVITVIWDHTPQLLWTHSNEILPLTNLSFCFKQKDAGLFQASFQLTMLHKKPMKSLRADVSLMNGKGCSIVGVIRSRINNISCSPFNLIQNESNVSFFHAQLNCQHFNSYFLPNQQN